ncbi:hypothetical protein BD560DRAFT_436418 [Blakeslea trispora]|nr:hypothetical protein BD560DRAFT_436418 [Blakeslea trispora]
MNSILAIILFVFSLTVVAADDWIAAMSCMDNGAFNFRLEHHNDLGVQVIVWNPSRFHSLGRACSSDGVICVKDVVVLKETCQQVGVDFKVQYANTWSRYTHVELKGVGDSRYFNVNCEPVYFAPEFV